MIKLFDFRSTFSSSEKIHFHDQLPEEEKSKKNLLHNLEGNFALFQHLFVGSLIILSSCPWHKPGERLSLFENNGRRSDMLSFAWPENNGRQWKKVRLTFAWPEWLFSFHCWHCLTFEGHRLPQCYGQLSNVLNVNTLKF